MEQDQGGIELLWRSTYLEITTARGGGGCGIFSKHKYDKM